MLARWTAASLLRPVRVKEKPGRPAFDPAGNFIAIHESTSPSEVAHEMVHAIEAAHPAVLAAARAFLAKRTAGESAQPLTLLEPKGGYRTDEVALEDEWKKRGGEHYCGKLYSPTGQVADTVATELLTMGIERLDLDALQFHREDREYFWFVIQTLQNL